MTTCDAKFVVRLSADARLDGFLGAGQRRAHGNGERAARFCEPVVFIGGSFRGSFLIGREDDFPVTLHVGDRPAVCLTASYPIL